MFMILNCLNKKLQINWLVRVTEFDLMLSVFDKVGSE